MTVLVVDDEPMITEVLSAMLEIKLGAKVLTTNEPEEVLQLVAGSSVDVMVTDYLMPHLNGVQLVQALRQAGANMPVIMLTGYMNNAELEQGRLDLGRFSLMGKPWENEELIGRIRSLMDEAPAAG